MPMPFKKISFASLLHDGFCLEPQDLIEHIMLDNEIRPYAERALLKSLLQEHLGRELPALSGDDQANAWEHMRYRLGYIEGSRTEEFLAGVDVSRMELSKAINVHLRVEKFVDQFIGELLNDESKREAVLWEMLIDLSLRERVIRAAGKEYLSSNNGSEEPNDDMRAAVRTHLMLKHDKSPWTYLVEKLVKDWGMTSERINRLVDVLAKAHWQNRKEYTDGEAT